MKNTLKIIQKTSQKIIQLFFPSKCLSCQEIVSFDANFCTKCWLDLEYIKAPHCQICSYPFEYNIIDNNQICATCLKKPPFFDETATIFRYNEVIGNAIANYKYRDQTHLAKIFAQIIFAHSKNFIQECDLICAVPIHKNKLKFRKFNQSILIAKHLDSSRLIYDLVIRKKELQSQVRLGQKKRIKNLKSAFKINPKHQEKIKDKIILIVDDVITTSTTVNSLAKILKKNGAKKVKVLTIAKTVFS